VRIGQTGKKQAGTSFFEKKEAKKLLPIGHGGV
jgi:hypothetical protein